MLPPPPYHSQVETIGDCYLAITGLPEPRPDHAVVMVRFAKEISNKMLELTGKLEEALGPDTATLQIRIGKFCHYTDTLPRISDLIDGAFYLTSRTMFCL